MELEDHEEMPITIEASPPDSPRTVPPAKGSHLPENHFSHTFHLSICTFLSLIGFNGVGPMLTPVYGIIGSLTASLSWLVWGLGSATVAPLLVRRLGIKRCLLVGLFGYTLFPLTLLDPSGVLMILLGAGCGLSGSVFFNAQSLFASNASTPQTIGIHNGIFFTLLLSTNLVGNGLSYVILADYSLPYFIGIAFPVAALGIIIALAMPNTEESSGQSSSKRPEEAPSILTTLQCIWEMAWTSRRLQLYTPAMMWHGAILGVWLTWFPTNILSPCYGASAIGIYMSSFGASNAIGSLLMGVAVDKLSRRTAWFCAVMLSSVVAVVGCAVLREACLPGAHYVFAALMGLEDAACNQIFGSVMVAHFSLNPTQMSYAAGWWRLSLGLSAFLVVLTAYHLPNYVVEFLSLVAAITTTGFFFAAEKWEDSPK